MRSAYAANLIENSEHSYSVCVTKTRVRKEGKRVSNALCTAFNMYMYAESNATSRLVHVTMQITKKCIFTPTLKSRSSFSAFSDRFYLYTRFCRALSTFFALIHSALKATPTIKVAQPYVLIGQ